MRILCLASFAAQLILCAPLEAQVANNSTSSSAAMTDDVFPKMLGPTRLRETHSLFTADTVGWTWQPLYDFRAGIGPYRFILMPYKTLGVLNERYEGTVFDDNFTEVSDQTQSLLELIQSAAQQGPIENSSHWDPKVRLEILVPDLPGERFVLAPMRDEEVAKIVLSMDYLSIVTELASLSAFFFDSFHYASDESDVPRVASLLLTLREMFIRSERFRASNRITFFDFDRVMSAYGERSSAPMVKDLTRNLNRVILAHEACHHFLGHTDPNVRSLREQVGESQTTFELEADLCALTITDRLRGGYTEAERARSTVFDAYLLTDFALITFGQTTEHDPYANPSARFNKILELSSDATEIEIDQEWAEFLLGWLVLFSDFESIQSYGESDEGSQGLYSSEEAINPYLPSVLDELKDAVDASFKRSLDDSADEQETIEADVAKTFWHVASLFGGETEAGSELRERLSELARLRTLDLHERPLTTQVEWDLGNAFAHARLYQLLWREDPSTAAAHRLSAQTFAKSACKKLLCNDEASRGPVLGFQLYMDFIERAYLGDHEALVRDIR